MLSKGRILKAANPVFFSMPLLDKTDNLEMEDFIQKDALYLEQNALSIEREAYEKGYLSGEKAGIEMGEQKAALLLERLEVIISQIESLKENIIKEAESHILGIALEIAQKIVLEEISVKPEVMVRMTKEAMKKIERIGQIAIKISPLLYELFMKFKPDLMELHADIIFDIDPSMAVTGTAVIGHLDEVVTDINEQLNNISDDIRGSLGTS